MGWKEALEGPWWSRGGLGCCGGLGAPGPALVVPWGCGAPGTGPSGHPRTAHPEGALGAGLGSWDAAGAGPRPGTMGEFQRGASEFQCVGLSQFMQSQSCVPPGLGGGSGTPRLQRLVPVPHVHGTASGNLLLMRSPFQAFYFPKCSIKHVLPHLPAGLGPPRWGHHTSPGLGILT